MKINNNLSMNFEKIDPINYYLFSKKFTSIERRIFPLSINKNFYRKIHSLFLLKFVSNRVGFIYKLNNDSSVNSYEVGIYIFHEHRNKSYAKSALLNFMLNNINCYLLVSRNNLQMSKIIADNELFKSIPMSQDISKVELKKCIYA